MISVVQQSSKRAKKDVSDTEDHSDVEEERKKPSSSRKPTSKAKSAVKGRKGEEETDDEEGESNDDDNEDDDEGGDGGDELASIKGIKPNVYLKDGDEKEVQSQTRFVYIIFGIYSIIETNRPLAPPLIKSSELGITTTGASSYSTCHITMPYHRFQYLSCELKKLISTI